MTLPQCIARKVPELCKAYTPGKSDQDIHARLLRLENIIEQALPQFAGGEGPPSPAYITSAGQSRAGESSSQTPDEDGSQNGEVDGGMGSFDGGGKWYGNSVSGSVAPSAMLQQVRNLDIVLFTLFMDLSFDSKAYKCWTKPQPAKSRNCDEFW